ncbi:hypothetical protein Landi51_12733 [Colletotrichum acutatum]
MNHPKQPPPPPPPLTRASQLLALLDLQTAPVENSASRSRPMASTALTVAFSASVRTRALHVPRQDIPLLNCLAQTPSQAHRVLLELKRLFCFQSCHTFSSPTIRRHHAALIPLFYAFEIRRDRRRSPGTHPQKHPISINRGTSIRTGSRPYRQPVRWSATPRKLAEHEQQQDYARVHGCRRKSITFVRSFVSSVKVADNTSKEKK